MKILKTVIKKTFIYGFFNSLSASVPFLLLPVLTNYLSTEGYGIIAIMNIIILFLSAIFRLEIQAALKYEYVEKKDDFASYVGTALIVPIAILIIGLILFLLSYPFLDSFWGIPPLWFLGILIMAAAAACANYLSALYQIRDDATRAGLWEMAISIPVFFITFVLVVFFAFDWQGRIWALFVTSIFIHIPFSFYFIYKIIPYKLSLDWSKLIEMLKFSMPLIPATIIVYILQFADRIFITEMLGLEVAGVYAVAVQLAMIMELIYRSFLPTWEVFVLQKLQEDSKEGYQHICMFFSIFVIGMLILSVLVMFVLPYIIPFIIGKNFISSMQYLPWLVFAMTMRGIYQSLLPFIYYTKKTMIVMYSNLFLVCFYCFLNYILILQNGAIGAAQSAFFTNMLGILIFLYVIIVRKIKG